MRDKTPDDGAVRGIAEPSMEKRFQHLFGSMTDAAYLIKTSSARILTCNDAAERQTGYSRDELIEKNIEKDLQIQDPDISAAAVTEKS